MCVATVAAVVVVISKWYAPVNFRKGRGPIAEDIAGAATAANPNQRKQHMHSKRELPHALHP